MNKKFKFQLSKFDIIMIVLFVVVGLIGFGAWWYLSGQLQAAQADDAQVATGYNKYATTKGIIVSTANAKALYANSDLLQTQLDPIIATYLLAKKNDLGTVGLEDPVAWKKDLDDDVKALKLEAKGASVALPDNFYFGFSRYLTESPGDAATAVLTKQRKAITTIVDILLKAPVKSITRVQRTYEEDTHGGRGAGDHPEGDQIAGGAVVVPNTYTAYPFEVDFDCSPEALRTVLSELLKSSYLFVVRSVEVHSDQLDSPRLDDLPRIAGSNGSSPSVISSAPGDVAASSAPTVGPQYLFGYAPLHVKIRVDLIEWNPKLTSVAALDQLTTPPGAKRKP